MYGVPGCRRQRKMTSTDLQRTVNVPSWADFNLLLQKELTTKVYNIKHSSTDLKILKEEEMFACLHTHASKKGGKMKITPAPIRKITVPKEWTSFLPILKQWHKFPEIKQNRAIFVRMKKNKDFIKVRRKQSYNKHLIRYGWSANMVGIFTHRVVLWLA